MARRTRDSAAEESKEIASNVGIKRGNKAPRGKSTSSGKTTIAKKAWGAAKRV